MKNRTMLAVAALAGVAAGATAAPELFIDINTLTATFSGGGGFTTTSTGSILLTANANSVLAGVRKDGVAQTVTSTLSTFSGRIDLVGGFVTGGFVSILNADASSYTADIFSGVGQVTSQAGQGFSIDGLTFNGLFSSTFFAGVNVTGWFNNQPRPGSVITFAFNPNSNGVDTNSDVDLYVVGVPMPAAAGMGFAGLAGLGLRRRR